MTGMSAVANSDRCTPVPHPVAKCGVAAVVALSASSPSAMTAVYLATVAMVMTAAARRTPI